MASAIRPKLIHRVYVPNKGAHEYSDAERFGKLVYITEGTIPSPYEVSEMYRKVVDALKGSSPDDYILVTGLTVICMITAALFAFKHGRINLLIWHDSPPRRRYIERKVVLSNLVRSRSIEKEIG